MAMANGYSQSYTWFLNNDEKKKAVASARKFLSFTMIEKMIKNSYVRGLPISIDELDKYIKTSSRGGKFKVFWGARMSIEKNPKLMGEIMGKLLSSDREVELVATTHKASSILMKSVLKSSYGALDEVNFGCPRDEFLEKMSKSHLFLCTSTVEGFPVGFIEQLYVLGIGMFPNRKWVTELFPKEYPYIYAGVTEAHNMLRWIYDNYDEALKKSEWIREWIRDNYNGEKIAEEFHQTLIDSLKVKSSDGYTGTRVGNFSLIIDDYIKETAGKDFTYEDLIEFVEKNADSWKASAIKRVGATTCHEIHEYVLTVGYIDTCEEEYPVYKKLKK